MLTALLTCAGHPECCLWYRQVEDNVTERWLEERVLNQEEETESRSDFWGVAAWALIQTHVLVVPFLLFGLSFAGLHGFGKRLHIWRDARNRWVERENKVTKMEESTWWWGCPDHSIGADFDILFFNSSVISIHPVYLIPIIHSMYIS